MKVDERQFRGEVHGSVLRIEYEAEQSSGPPGRAEAKLQGDRLAWRVLATTGETDYTVRRAVLRRGKPLLDQPVMCAP